VRHDATVTTSPEHQRAVDLATTANAAGDPTWFERLYAEADRGAAAVPWDHDEVNPRLANRISEPGTGRALVVGCGYGRDANHLRGLGYDVTAFDLSATAIDHARKRYPDVDFTVADVLDAPAEWTGAFDLVVEAYTIQVLRGPDRATAIRAIAGFVAPGGRALVISFAAHPDDDPPRIALAVTAEELDGFVAAGLTAGHVDLRPPSELEPPARWFYVADFSRR